MDKIKCRSSFYFILISIAVVSCLLFFLLWGIFKAVAVTAGIIAEMLWCVYFYSLKYSVCENSFIAKSGILFRKTRKIDLSDIVLEVRISIGRTVLATIVRTSGGSVVIFGKLQLTP